MGGIVRRSGSRPGHGLLVLAIPFGCAACCFAAASADSQGTISILFPRDESVIDYRKFELIAVVPGVAPELQVDGEVHPWEPSEAPVRVSRLELSPGKHVITLGEGELTFFVSGRGVEAPPDWPTVRPHPPIGGDWKQCKFCHEVEDRGGRKKRGPFMGYKACYYCHSETDFGAIHSHVEEPLNACESCHDLHASSRPSLLRAPARELCTECHD